MEPKLKEGQTRKVDPEEAIDTTTRRGRMALTPENDLVEDPRPMVRAQERAGMTARGRLRDAENALARHRNSRRD